MSQSSAAVLLPEPLQSVFDVVDAPPTLLRAVTPTRHTCVACGERPARFRYHGEVRADRTHTLCFECYRAEVNRARAVRLVRPSRDVYESLARRRRAAQIRARHELDVR